MLPKHLSHAGYPNEMLSELDQKQFETLKDDEFYFEWSGQVENGIDSRLIETDDSEF